MTQAQPVTGPFAASIWRTIGRELGLQNLPRKPADPAPARDTLRAALLTEARALRARLVQEIHAADKDLTAAHDRCDQLVALGSHDPYVAAAVPAARRKVSQLERHRQFQHESLCAALEDLIASAQQADAVWRAENESVRSRRLTLAETPLSLPTELFREVPHPLV